MKSKLDLVGKDSTITMAIRGPSGRTLLLHDSQGTLMNITLLKQFMDREKEYKYGKQAVRK